MHRNGSDAKRLADSFFRDNPLKELSAAMIAYSKMYIEQNDALSLKMDELVLAHIDDVRAARIARERQQIEQSYDPAVWIDLMRRCDVLNHRLLSEKIAANADQAMPLLLKKYCTSLQDEFIELANLVFVRSDVCYTQTLWELYPQIRAPYAQACACLAFGMCAMRQEIPFLLEQYRRFQRDYPKESFSQFPLLALYLLHGKMANLSSAPGF